VIGGLDVAQRAEECSILRNRDIQRRVNLTGLSRIRRTTRLYDRRQKKITRNVVERISI
jgi:hypothetical protein